MAIVVERVFALALHSFSWVFPVPPHATYDDQVLFLTFHKRLACSQFAPCPAVRDQAKFDFRWISAYHLFHPMTKKCLTGQAWRFVYFLEHSCCFSARLDRKRLFVRHAFVLNATLQFVDAVSCHWFFGCTLTLRSAPFSAAQWMRVLKLGRFVKSKRGPADLMIYNMLFEIYSSKSKTMTEII